MPRDNVSSSEVSAMRDAIVRRLRASVGKSAERATLHDWRMALSLALRDLVMEPWFASAKATCRARAKRVHYLSMEFLVGRLIEDVAANLGVDGAAREAMASLGQDYPSVVAEEPEPALGNGGLGRLAACFMDSLATLSIPAYGYGIRYEHGLFEQRFDNGMQVESAEAWLSRRHVWEFERPEVSYPVRFGGSVGRSGGNVAWHPEETVIAAAYDTPIIGWRGKWANTLRLWAARPARPFDLESFNRGDFLAASAPESQARTLSRVLYPDDATEAGRELRLKQEYFFTSASLQDVLRRLVREGHAPADLARRAAIQLNDTHPAIAGPELVRLLADDHGMKMSDAIRTARGCLAFTNHTLLPEALERWPEGLFARVLPRHHEIVGIIQQAHLRETGSPVRIVDGGEVRMGELAFVMARRVNGVSAVHSRLVKRTVFADLLRAYPGRVVNQTNGITPRRWLHACNEPLRDLIDDAVGAEWPDDLERLAGLRDHLDDAGFLERFRAAKTRNKRRLAGWLQDRIGVRVDPDAMFDVHIKRIHEYKRQLMNILETVALWNEIRDAPNGDWTPRVKLFGGKAAPGYAMAKSIIRLINDVAETINRERGTRGLLQVVYPPNYNVSMAGLLVPAADLSEQISTAGMEASGTGNMKLALNGALTIGTLDGANVEIREHVGAENFFLFGLTAEEAAERRAVTGFSREAIEASPRLGRALRQVSDGTFSGGDAGRHEALLRSLHDHDRFLVTCDFDSYFETQRRIDRAYGETAGWNRMAARNTAGMGWFSSDRAVLGYAKDIWNAFPMA